MSATTASALASIPSPPWDGIEIGPLHLRFYGLAIALGVLAAVWLCGRLLERKRIGTTDDASAIGVWGAAGGIVGARLYHVFTEWDRFSGNLGDIPKIWEGGLGIPGGLLLGTFVGIWQAKRRGIRAGAILTCAAPAIPLAQAIGRLGNYFNQELYGRPTDLPWALEIDDPVGYPPGTTFHPTFLYEMLWNLGLTVVLLRIDRKLRLGPGRLMAVYLMGYGAGRFWVEGLRIDPADELGGLRWNQWVALAAVAAGAIWLVATRGQKWPDDPAELRVDGKPFAMPGAPDDDVEPEDGDVDGDADPDDVEPEDDDIEAAADAEADADPDDDADAEVADPDDADAGGRASGPI